MIGVTVLGSCSTGNALIIHSDGQTFLLDNGFSLKQLRMRLAAAGIDESEISAILVSHEHSDHCRGLGVAARGLKVPVYCTRATASVLRERGQVGDQVNLFAAGTAFDLGNVRVEPFSIPHDAIDPVGFTFTSRGLKVGVATDLGHPSGLVCHHLCACNILILESNHDIPMLHISNRPWRLKQRIMGRHGHLSNIDSMALFRRVVHARTKHLILAHASRECNAYELVVDLVRNSLEELGRPDITPHVALQDTHLPTIWAE